MTKKREAENEKNEQKITRPIMVVFTERALKAVVRATNTTKMCYGDSILADTRSMAIILDALLKDKEDIVVDFEEET